MSGMFAQLHMNALLFLPCIFSKNKKLTERKTISRVWIYAEPKQMWWRHFTTPPFVFWDSCSDNKMQKTLTARPCWGILGITEWNIKMSKQSGGIAHVLHSVLSNNSSGTKGVSKEAASCIYWTYLFYLFIFWQEDVNCSTVLHKSWNNRNREMLKIDNWTANQQGCREKCLTSWPVEVIPCSKLKGWEVSGCKLDICPVFVRQNHSSGAGLWNSKTTEEDPRLSLDELVVDVEQPNH